MKSELRQSDVVDWNPKQGVACQGDVVLMRIPEDKMELIFPYNAFSEQNEIAPKDQHLILAEGELTGHHHSIFMPNMLMDTGAGSGADVMPSPARVGVAKLYRIPRAYREMERLGMLLTTELAIGVLRVTEGHVVLTHQEHAGIRIPKGVYYVGGQRELAGSLEKTQRVYD